MKSFLASIVALVVISAGAYATLNKSFQESAEMKYSTGGVRLEPGKH